MSQLLRQKHEDEVSSDSSPPEDTTCLCSCSWCFHTSVLVITGWLMLKQMKSIFLRSESQTRPETSELIKGSLATLEATGPTTNHSKDMLSCWVHVDANQIRLRLPQRQHLRADCVTAVGPGRLTSKAPSNASFHPNLSQDSLHCSGEAL